uniref:Uncharacterized protein n=1 Tax=viral metagenome TaxID=1070528 RepID=A0A6C0K5A1_9ZZZZ
MSNNNGNVNAFNSETLENVNVNVNSNNMPAKKNNSKNKPVSYMPSWMTTGTQKNYIWSEKENRNAANAVKANTAKVSAWGKNRNRTRTAWEIGVGKAPTNTLGKSAGTGCYRKGSDKTVVCGVTRNAAAQMGGRNKNKTKKNKNKKNKINKNRN